MKPVIYTKTDCRQCVMTIKVFETEGIGYDTKPILEPENLAYVKNLGFMAAPVIVTDTDAWAGFQPDRITALKERNAA